MKIIVSGILTLLMTVLFAETTLGQCDCMINVSKDIRGSRYTTALEELRNSDAVFYGQVVEMKLIPRKPAREGDQDYETEIKFRVEKAWRKDLNEFVTLRDYSSGCGIGFSIASRWIVYANLDDEKHFRTGYCTRTRVAYRNPEKDFEEFERNGVKQTKITRESKSQ